MSEICVQVDWEQLDMRMRAVDEARRPVGLGRVGSYDVLGGTYHRRGDGLAELYSARRAVEQLAGDCWSAIHGTRRRLDERLALLAPKRGDWWAATPDIAWRRESVSRRGAKMIARRRPSSAIIVEPGAVLRGRVWDEEIARARALCRLAIAVSKAYEELYRIGIGIDPSRTICGTGPGYGLVGLRWLAGDAQEKEPPSRYLVYLFAIGEADINMFRMERAA